MSSSIEDRVLVAVDAWLRWVPTWHPGTHRGRSRMCRQCTGSPVLEAAGIAADVPHQVAHALSSRMKKIIERVVDEYTERELPALHAELTGEQMWHAGGFEPEAGLDPEYEGIDLDPEVEGDQPYLFTLAGLAEETRPEPPLPRPPLSPAEKQQLLREIEYADRFAENAGQRLCFALAEHRDRIRAAVDRFVEPQVQAMLEELSRSLLPPQ